MWQHAFPELIASFEGLTDATALAAYVEGVNVAGAERLAATDLSEDDIVQCETFAASVVAVEAHLAELAEQAAADVEAEKVKAARIAGLSFKRPVAPPPAPSTGNAPPSAPPTTGAAETGDFQVFPEIVAVHQVGRFDEGHKMTSLVEQSEALVARAKRLMKSNTGEKFSVLRVQNYIPENLKMPEDGMEMFNFLQNDQYDEDGLVAGFCAPATIDLGFCGGSPSTRPVLAALRRYNAPTGRVRKIKTPLFGAVGTAANQVDTTGLGVWTNADDDANPFVEKTCSILTCPTEEDFELYAIYKCVVIKNFMQLAFPTWVAWYLQQLDALWARSAEISLLNQMVTRAGAAITTSTTYGALTTVVSRLNQLMNNYVENERYDDAGLTAYMPRWVVRALQDDAIRAGKMLTKGQIESALRDTGVTRIVWTYDNPTAYNDVITQAKGTPLEDYPANAWILLTRSDNLRLMDFGARDIGITTEKVYRDTATNLANNFQMFVESFEGIIDMGCPVWRFQIPICSNGIIAPTSGYLTDPCISSTPITGA